MWEVERGGGVDAYSLVLNVVLYVLFGFSSFLVLCNLTLSVDIHFVGSKSLHLPNVCSLSDRIRETIGRCQDTDYKSNKNRIENRYLVRVLNDI